MKRSYESSESSTSQTQDKMARTDRAASEPIVETYQTYEPYQFENSNEQSDENSNEQSDENCQNSTCELENSESSEESVPPLRRQENIYLFVPTNCEKQIIRHSLAMIGRSNTSDWNYEISDEGVDNMALRETCIIVNENRTGINCEIVTEVCCSEDVTSCRITYRYEGQKELSEIFYNWDNFHSYINFSKPDTISYYFVFSSPIVRRYSITPENIRADSWCYFQDVRSHLNSLRIF
jgi:hypothetical protein